MDFEHAKDWVIGLVRENLTLAGPAVFCMGFAEGIPLLSLLVTSTPLFLGIGAAHAAAGGQFWPLWIGASVGAIISDCLVYTMGRIFKGDAHRIWPFSRWMMTSLRSRRAVSRAAPAASRWVSNVRVTRSLPSPRCAHLSP